MFGEPRKYTSKIIRHRPFNAWTIVVDVEGDNMGSLLCGIQGHYTQLEDDMQIRFHDLFKAMKELPGCKLVRVRYPRLAKYLFCYPVFGNKECAEQGREFLHAWIMAEKLRKGDEDWWR